MDWLGHFADTIILQEAHRMLNMEAHGAGLHLSCALSSNLAVCQTGWHILIVQRTIGIVPQEDFAHIELLI